MTDYITGTVNHYYADQNSADQGLSYLCEKMYAQQNLDNSWNVFWQVYKPALPNGVDTPAPSERARIFALIATFSIPEEPHVIATSVTREVARNMLREHETSPTRYEGLPIIHKKVNTGDKDYWRAKPLPEMNML